MDDEKLREEFPGNSYTSIKPRKESDVPEKVEGKNKDNKGRVREKKRTVGERIADSFLATDKEEVREHLIFDWFIPGIKTIIEDLIHMILYGDASRGDGRIRRRDGESSLRRVNYNSIYDDRRRRDDEYISRRGSRKPELTFDRRSDAEQVLSGMSELIEDYGRATMKDFYNLVSEVTYGEIDIPTEYTMTRYGWSNLSAASITHVRDGYLLRMPRAEVIER